MRIALFSPFQNFHDTYSIAHVVCDQARGLLALGYDVQIWTLRNASIRGQAIKGLEQYVKPILSSLPNNPDELSPRNMAQYRDDLLAAEQEYMPQAVIAHDVLLLNWFTNIAWALHSMKTQAKWYHYLHSAPWREPLTEANQWRRKLPVKHDLIVPSQGFNQQYKQYYSTNSSRIHVCPNAHDARSVWGVSDPVAKLVSKYGLLEKDIVCVLPFCTTRYDSKGVHHILNLLASLKRKGVSVCFVGANANAMDQQHKLFMMRNLEVSLSEDEVVLTSEQDETWKDHVPFADVISLLRFCNVFILPSMAEVNSLAMIEAQLNGCVVVANSKVPSTAEHAAPGTILAEFDTCWAKVHYHTTRHHREENHETGQVREWHEFLGEEDSYRTFLDELADKVLLAVCSCRSLQARRFAMKKYSYTEHARRLVEIIRA